MKFFFRATTIMLLLLTRTPASALAAQITQTDPDRRTQIDETCPQSFKHSLSGLYSISDLNSVDISQPTAHFDALYQQANLAQNELTVLCKSIALNTQTTPLFSGVKSKERAQEKIQKELNGHADQITDLARATIVAKDIPSLVYAFEQLQQQATVVQIKNRFKTPTPSGYRDLKILVKLPKTGIVSEVQFHLAEIADIKNGQEHKIYEQVQLIERTAALENRELNDIETAQMRNLRAQSQDLYHDAWQYYLTPKPLKQTA